MVKALQVPALKFQVIYSTAGHQKCQWQYQVDSHQQGVTQKCKIKATKNPRCKFYQGGFMYY